MRHPCLVALLGVVVASAAPVQTQPDPWTSTFAVAAGDLSSTGRNPFFILEPGYELVLEHGGERLVITVLNDTRTVDGVETRIVEERETNGGRLVEVSRNFLAIDRRTNDVYYFGEDVDMYKNGRVTSHDGSWTAGAAGARFGLMMPGSPRVGARYYQEFAPRVAMDRAMVVSLDARVVTPARTFTNCLQTEETTPIERGAREAKYYARDVGIVQDGSLKLVRWSGAPGR